MSEEKRKILEHLVEYLQDKIDTGYHKIFYNDDMYDEKTIDCINAINDTLEENKRLNNIINELEKYLNEQVDYMTHHSIERMVAFDCCRHRLQELKGNNNGVWVNNLLEVIKENNIEFGSDKE